MPGLTPEATRALFDALSGMAEKRTQEAEGKLFSLADYDPARLHNFDTNYYFEPSTHYPSAAMRYMFGALLDAGTGHGQQWVEGMVDGLRDQLAQTDIPSRLKDGQGLLVLTAHKTRFEPTAVALLMESALAGEDEVAFDALRKRAKVIVSAYLSTIDLNLAALTRDPNTRPINMLDLACQLGGVATTFPDTDNMRKAGVSEEISQAHNARMARSLLESVPGGGPLITLAANATFEKLDKHGVYPITQVAPGTAKLVKFLAKNRSFEAAVVAVASDHAPADSSRAPFSVLSPVVAPENVSPDTAHHAMDWITAALRSRGVPASYNMPTDLSSPSPFARADQLTAKTDG